MGRLTRREAAALVLTAPLLAQSGAPPQGPRQITPAPQTVTAAEDEVRQAGQRLRAIDVPMHVEPAFLFKV
jgi:hypothetical protein